MAAKDKKTRIMEMLKERGILRSVDFGRHGVSRTQVRRLCEQGRIERISRGFYTLPGTILTERHSLAVACLQVPAGVICLLSALRFHGLTTQNPSEVWMAVPRGSWTPGRDVPGKRYFYLSANVFSQGVENHFIQGVPIRVTSAAKTVADCFKFRNKIGMDVAVEAIRDYRKKYPKGLNALWRFAEVDRVTRVIRPYLEALG